PGEQSGSGNVGAPCFGSATRLLADEDAAERRCIDDAQNRSPVLDKCNIDGELAVAADEFLGAVERIDEIETLRHSGDLAGRSGFFRYHRRRWVEPRQSGQND